ncbi:phosphoglycerate mutase [Marinithermofilum abyssi]|uniref:Phosphoglycerate mutase n=1 Tax=Marinithermofilum abyssi TaxID=1571185 RepID=A0A8J2VG89_9BACL|nr:histidine phosphatase family protein [Marinithermofilum abyssi]GGE07704.1 phosphoglycerate mutase [Marinithermofilum abyssi]
MKWIWIRHGETIANRTKRYCGHWDLPLLRDGEIRVQETACQWKGWVDRLVTSDLRRCMDTARIWHKRFPSASWSVRPELRELGFGEWEGLTFDEIQQQDPNGLQRWLDDPEQQSPPGGESVKQMCQRLAAWLHEERTSGKADETVAVITHGGPIRWFLSWEVRQAPHTFWEDQIPPGGWVAVEDTGRGWRVAAWSEDVKVKDDKE